MEKQKNQSLSSESSGLNAGFYTNPFQLTEAGASTFKREGTNNTLKTGGTMREEILESESSLNEREDIDGDESQSTLKEVDFQLTVTQKTAKNSKNFK